MNKEKTKKKKKKFRYNPRGWCDKWFCLRSENHKGKCSDYVG